MSSPKSTSRSLYIDSSAAEAALDKLTKKMKTLETEISKGTLEGDKLNKKIAQLDDTKKSVQSLQDQISKGLKPTFIQVQNQVTQLRNELKRMSEDAPGFAQKFDAYKKANTTLGEMQAKINGVSKAQTEMGGSFGKIFTHVAEAFTSFKLIDTVFEKTKEFFKNSIEEANRAEEASSRLRNTLENIGRIDAFDRLKNKAGQLAEQFKFLDNDDLIEVQQKLITYGKLTEGQINQLLPVIINFAAKSKISVAEASEVMIKALEGNSKSLKEYGISVKDGNTVTERMGILMSDLAPRVEGAADAFGKTMAGEAAIAKQKLADVEEEVGGKLIPVLTKLYQWAGDAITGMSKFADILKASFETGSLLTGTAIVRAQAVAAQQEKINNEAAASILLRVQDKTIEEKEKFLEQLNVKVLDLEFKLDQAKQRNDKETIKNLQETIGGWEKAREMLQAEVTASKDKRILGVGDNNPTDTAAQKKAEDARKKASKDWDELIAKINDGLAKSTQDPYIYELNKILQERIAQIKQVIELGKEAGKTQEQIKAAIDLINKEASQKSFKLGQGLIASVQQNIRDTKLQGPGAVPLPEHLDFINDPNLAVIGPHIQDRDKQDEEDRKRRHEKQQEQLDELVDYSNQAVSVYTSFSNFRTNIENAALNKELKANEVKKASYKRMLDSKMIGQKEYEAKVAALDRETDAKKQDIERKQFRRNQITSIAETLIAGAQAEIKLWDKPGFPGAIPLGILLGAETLAKVAFIAGQKPSFGKGGLLTGDSHTNGGMPVINRKTGRAEAEVEGGEVILSKNTVKNNWDAISPLLHSSMNEGGRRITPWWQTRSYQAINYPAIQNTFAQKRYFESGGMFTKNNDQTNQPAQPVIIHDEETKQILLAVLDHLRNPVAPVVNVDVPLKKIDDARNQQARITAAATFK